MRRTLLCLVFSILLVSCGSPFARVILAPTDVPIVNSFDELPIRARSELGAYKMVTNDIIEWPSAHPDSIVSLRFSRTGRYYVYINSPIVIGKKGLPSWGDETVGVIDIETGKNITLVSKAQTFPDAVAFSSATFAPDEKRIMFVVYWENSTDLVEVDIASKQIRRLNVDRRLTHFGWPDISVKGQIVVICDKVTDNKLISELCLLDKNGEFIRYLTNEGYPWPGYGLFTPDGEWVVYESRYKLYQVRVDGSSRQEVIPCALMGPRLVTENYVVTECRISEEPPCQAVFVASLDGKNFWRLGYLRPVCSEDKNTASTPRP